VGCLCFCVNCRDDEVCDAIAGDELQLDVSVENQLENNENKNTNNNSKYCLMTAAWLLNNILCDVN